VEDGNLNMVEEMQRKKGGGRKRRVIDDDDEYEVKKPKKRRGRPPVEKVAPNPPKLTSMMRKLIDIVINYRDRYSGTVASTNVIVLISHHNVCLCLGTMFLDKLEIQKNLLYVNFRTPIIFMYLNTYSDYVSRHLI